MKFYSKQHKFYCGIDLHTKKMYVCIINEDGQIIFHKNLNADSENLEQAIKPFANDIVICVECVFTWYWIADFCQKNNIPFVLGHALYMKAISGGKTKSDKIDSEKIATLLKGGLIPMAYVYPEKTRAIRDLFRRRIYLVRRRADLLSHIQNTNTQYSCTPIKKGINSLTVNSKNDLLSNIKKPAVKMNIEVDLAIIDALTIQIKSIESKVLKAAKHFDPQLLGFLKSIPGVGDILALTFIFEIDDINRFPKVQNFVSYCRVVKCQRESAGKKYASKNTKIGNATLKWAFSEAAIALIRYCPEVKKSHLKRVQKFGKAKSYTIMAHKLARAVYYILKRRKAFDVNIFCGLKRVEQTSLAHNYDHIDIKHTQDLTI